MVVERGTVHTIKQFYELMERTRDARARMVSDFLATDNVAAPGPAAATGRVAAGDLALLKDALAMLHAIPTVQGRKRLALDAKTSMDIELDYEIAELEKDILFFDQGGLEQHLATRHADFERHVDAACRVLAERYFRNFITDRDGTINNYCGRYRSSIQSAYNAIYLMRFARARCEGAAIVTSGPLAGLERMSVLPPGAYVLAGSKGREYLDTRGNRRSMAIPHAVQRKLDAVYARLRELVARPEYEAFSLIGSGLQRKLGELTLAVQDISGTIPDHESKALLGLVEGIVREVDPTGEHLGLIDMGLDVEIVSKITRGGEFSKADGVAFLNEALRLGLEEGQTLVCGDTKGDLPLVAACLEQSDDVWAVFVTRDPKLSAEVRALTERAVIVPEVDILVTALGRLAQG